jgi:hypothetical protein
LVFSVGSLSHVDTRLFLVRKSLPEEIAVAGLLERIAGFDGEELLNARPDTLSARDVVQIAPRVSGLLFDPLASSRGVLVFEPAVGIRDWHTVQNLGDRLDG